MGLAVLVRTGVLTAGTPLIPGLGLPNTNPTIASNRAGKSGADAGH